MFCLNTFPLVRPAQTEIQNLTAIWRIVKLIPWNVVNLSHLYFERAKQIWKKNPTLFWLYYLCDFKKKVGDFFPIFMTFLQFLNFMKFLPCLDWCQWLFASLKFVWQNLNHKALFYPFSIYSVCASWSYEFVSFGKSFWLFASLLVPFSSLQRKKKCWNCQKVGNAIPSAGSYMY